MISTKQSIYNSYENIKYLGINLPKGKDLFMKIIKCSLKGIGHKKVESYSVFMD
jgi:hypothetical protein